jgi:hypothetical protein
MIVVSGPTPEITQMLTEKNPGLLYRHAGKWPKYVVLFGHVDIVNSGYPTAGEDNFLIIFRRPGCYTANPTAHNQGPLIPTPYWAGLVGGLHTDQQIAELLLVTDYLQWGATYAPPELTAKLRAKSKYPRDVRRITYYTAITRMTRPYYKIEYR